MIRLGKKFDGTGKGEMYACCEYCERAIFSAESWLYMVYIKEARISAGLQ